MQDELLASYGLSEEDRSLWQTACSSLPEELQATIFKTLKDKPNAAAQFTDLLRQGSAALSADDAEAWEAVLAHEKVMLTQYAS